MPIPVTSAVGTINPTGVVALHSIGYNRWTVLETDTPSKNVSTDAKRNVAYFHKLTPSWPKLGPFPHC